jgi:GNAT superfamily N-acetyltransferase
MARAARKREAEAAELSFKPVTAATRKDFIEVFDGPGGPKYCWCMAWRQTSAEVKDASGSSRKKQMLSRIDAKTPVGLVGYLDGEPLAWVSIAPRDTYRKLSGPEAEEGENIWSIVCMYTRRALRGQGLAHQMIAAAVDYAKKKKATAVEAYPVDPDSPSYRHMGFVPAYERAGFKETGRVGTRRHVVRLTLRRPKSA